MAVAIALAAIVTLVVAAGVARRLRRLHDQRDAMDQARMVGRFRAAAFERFQGAVDEEFAEIASREEGDL